MREHEISSYCHLCLEYVTGECTVEERFAFERHLSHCTECQKEIEELRSVWSVIHTDMERIEPPADLKQQVMDSVLAIESDQRDTRSSRKHIFNWRYTHVLVAAVLAVMVIGSLWIIQPFHEQTATLLPLEQASNVSATEIKRLITLNPQSTESSDSFGVACIVDNGDSKQFIVYVFGVDPTKGTEAYQVWLIENGERRSAGTFRVGDRGIGVLAMPIASDKLTFDSIGITLEPDDRGDYPRGKKIFGSL